MARLRLNPLTGLFDYDPAPIPDYIQAVVDTATIDLDVSGGILTANVIPSGIDHGSLSGLSDDDHPQYHTDSRALAWLGTRSTTDLAEGINLYYTDTRARLAISGAGGSPINYNNATGVIDLSLVPISYGGTGQSNAQAAINNLTNSAMTANEGDVLQWLGGNAQFAALSNAPYTIARYSSTGSLSNSNYWLIYDDGQADGGATYFTDNGDSLHLVADVQAATTVFNSDLYSGTLLNAGTMSGYNSLLNLNFSDAGGTTETLNGLNIGLQGNVTNDKQAASWYSNGTVGNSYGGLYLDVADTIVNDANFLTVNRTGTTGGNVNVYNVNWQAGADIAGGVNFLNVGMQANIGNYSSLINHNFNATATKGYGIINASIDGIIGDGTGTNLYGFNLFTQSTLTVDGSIIGFGLYNQADWSVVNGNFTGTDINNQGQGYTFTGVNIYNNQDQVESIAGINYYSEGDARTSTPISIYMQGNFTDDATGIRVNVQNATSTTQRINSLNLSGGVFNFNSVFRTAPSLFVDSGNTVFTEFKVANGSPITNTDAFVNNNVVAYLVEDDVALGPVGLGLSTSSAISLLGIATGKTVDTIRGLTIAASVQNPGYADAGHLNQFHGIAYGGALPGGGNTTIGESVGLLMFSGFDSYATSNWGIRVQGTTADNYLNKLAVGTASQTAASGLLLDVNGEVGITDEGSGLSIREGAAGRMGVVTLAAGTVTVANTSITASSRVFLTTQTAGPTMGALSIASVIPGTSFDVVSTDPTDVSTVAFLIIEPL